jgi:hypothetical protein
MGTDPVSSLLIKKFLEVREPFYKKVSGRRRQFLPGNLTAALAIYRYFFIIYNRA